MAIEIGSNVHALDKLDVEAINRMESEGPIPSRSPKAGKEIYDALDRRLMANMDWEGGASAADLGRRVRGGAISFAKVGAAAEVQRRTHQPGVNGNGKA